MDNMRTSNSIYAPYVKVIRFKDKVTTDGIYYVVSDGNTIDKCVAFEHYLNTTKDRVLKFDIYPLSSLEIKHLAIDNQGLNPVSGNEKSLIINSSWAIFDMDNCPFSILPRIYFVSMRHRVLNVDRISFLLDMLPNIVELNGVKSSGNVTFRHKHNTITSHIESMKHSFRSKIRINGNTCILTDSQMYDIYIDLLDTKNIVALLKRIMAFTEHGYHG